MSDDRKIRDVVVPLIKGGWEGNVFKFGAISGTAFLIGRRGFAITAAHVVDQVESATDAVLGFVDSRNEWIAVRVLSFETHSTEDVAVAQLETSPWPSWLVISDRSEHQSCDYEFWGYPISVAEISAKYEAHKMQSPDLVYTRGYIRRRISRSLPMSIYRGKSFYEISELTGEGCSGGPLINRRSVGRPTWDVCGIHIGDCVAGFSAAYAVRSDSFYSWCPSLMGRSLREESVDL